MKIRKNIEHRNGTPKLMTKAYIKEAASYNVLQNGLCYVEGSSRELMDNLSIALALGYDSKTMGAWHVPHIHQICEIDFRTVRNILLCNEKGEPQSQSRQYDLLQYCSMVLQLINPRYAKHVNDYCLQHEHRIDNGNQKAIPVKFLPTTFFKEPNSIVEIVAALIRLIGNDGQWLTNTTFVDIMERHYHQETMGCIFIPKWQDIAGKTNAMIRKMLKSNKKGEITVFTNYDELQYLSLCLQLVGDIDYRDWVSDYCFRQVNCLDDIDDKESEAEKAAFECLGC